MSRLRLPALIVGALLEGLALHLLWRGDATPVVVAAHGLGAFAWGYGAMRFFPARQEPAWWFVTSLALVFPVVGPLASLELGRQLRRPPPDRSARRYLVWKEQPENEWSGNSLPAGASGKSIVEILQSPRIQLRRNAVLALRDLDPQVAIPLLRKGLQDSDEQVRIYAQNILSSMLERFEDGIKELEPKVANDPTAAVRLAEQYFELVYLDVAGDDETAAHYLGKAQALLTGAAEASPQDASIALLGLKFSLRARDAHAARAWFSRVQGAALDARQVLPWEMELAFLEGNWARLRALFRHFVEAKMVNPRIDDVARYWLGLKEDVV